METHSVRVLLTEILDYAGLFPPAQLDLQTAVANQIAYQSSPHHWMLGRFVLPVGQLQQFDYQYPLSLILSQNWESELDGLQLRPLLSLEFPRLPPLSIEQACRKLPLGVEAFFEVPATDEPLLPYLKVLKQQGHSAKIRTGGIVPEAFLSVDRLSRCILEFAEAGISFKATAGLHHAISGVYSITNVAESLSTPMLGFLNVAILASLIYVHHISLTEAVSVLQDSSFQFTDTEINWQGRSLSLSAIADTRTSFFRSFGSCSFQEPIHDLKSLNLL
jgi:hypothetical protein